MKLLPVVPLASVALLFACSNHITGSTGSRPACDKSKAQRALPLADSAPAPTLPGGLLVFDRLDAKSYRDVGYAKATFKPGEKCSASFEVSKREGRYYARFATTEQCYTGFFRASKNPRLLLNAQGTSQYVEAKPKDERFAKAARYLALTDGFTPAFRENELISFLNRANASNISDYLLGIKGMTRANHLKYKKDFCYGGRSPIPKGCLWTEGHFDEVEIEFSASDALNADPLVAQTADALSASRKKLESKLAPSLANELLQFSYQMTKVSQEEDLVEAAVNIHRYLACDIVGDSNCIGVDRAALDRAAIAIADIYAPKWKVRAQQAASATTNRVDLVDAIFYDSEKDFLEASTKPYFAPAFESYLELRKVLGVNKDLLGIATNYVDPATGDAKNLAYRTLGMGAPELTGIGLTVDDKGNVLLSHAGKEKNRNLTMDGHSGSVVTFGGLPLLPFDPLSIDQSDANSVMPIPTASKRADRPAPSDASAKPSNGSTKTVGEGTAGSGC